MQRLISQTLAIKKQKVTTKTVGSFDPARVDVWLCEINRLQSCKRLIPLLTEYEQKRAAAILNLANQRAYIAAHLLLQWVLTQHYGICHRDLVLICNAHGKPCLEQYCHIHFNISHTDGMVAVAVSNFPVGVDVEHTLVKNPIALAQAFFAPLEIEDLVTNHSPARLFRRYWVAKEACVKAIGVGIGALLNKCVLSPKPLAGNAWCPCELDGQHMALCLPGGCSQEHDIAVAIKLKQRMVEKPILHIQHLRSAELLEWATDCRQAIQCEGKSVVLAA